mmetsp:Transcript_6679/g.11437  ORF Transcript_6679/g.11437 Transcript_6679/m.11437 type:complete len:423 (-) Transcript_6679:32-1300(-)
MATGSSLSAFDAKEEDHAAPAPYWDWDQNLTCPEVTDQHRAFRKTCRKFFEEEVAPYIDDWEEEGGFPEGLQEKAYEAGVYGASWPREYGGTFPAEEEWDPFFLYIFQDELGRMCAGGLYASLFTLGIGLPPILDQGTKEQKDLWVRDIIKGKKTVSLAITEPYGGSDVANMRTTAVREGDHLIVNGNKTFISGGMHADYFTTGVRTGSNGIGGVSLLLIPRDLPGVTTSRLKTQGWHSSTTTTISFDGVKVPCWNLLGEEGKGFKPIMLNFNNERFGLAVNACRMARCCIEDSVAYAKIRKTFGQPLMAHQVIRHKFAEMLRGTLATHSMVLEVARNMAFAARGAVSYESLAAQMALLKVQATKNMEFCAREASQVLGGRSYLRGGKGVRIERVYREVRVYAIGGGSEEVMLDLASRQSKL